MITANFTQQIPSAAVITSPVNDVQGVVDPTNLTVNWQAVSQDLEGGAINILGYQVIVEEDTDPEFEQEFFHRLFSAHLGATARSIRVPGEFMAPGKNYKCELAIEESGNQT